MNLFSLDLDNLTVIHTDDKGERFDLNAGGEKCENLADLASLIEQLDEAGAYLPYTSAPRTWTRALLNELPRFLVLSHGQTTLCGYSPYAGESVEDSTVRDSYIKIANTVAWYTGRDFEVYASAPGYEDWCVYCANPQDLYEKFYGF